MADFQFERECRTPYSEVYTILEEDAPVGRLDVHYTGNMIHASLAVAERLTQEEIQELIEGVDEEILDAVGINRDELVVHVHQGRDLGVYSDHGFSQNGGSEVES
jgi:hypothetical protein